MGLSLLFQSKDQTEITRQNRVRLLKKDLEHMTRSAINRGAERTCVPIPAMRPIASSQAQHQDANGPHTGPAKCAAQKYREPVVCLQTEKNASALSCMQLSPEEQTQAYKNNALKLFFSGATQKSG